MFARRHKRAIRGRRMAPHLGLCSHQREARKLRSRVNPIHAWIITDNKREHQMRKIYPEIIADWESYRGRTITTASGDTFDMMELGQRAYSAAEADCEEFQGCIDSLEHLMSEEECFRGETPLTVESGIIVARLKAELFRAKNRAYRQHKYERGLEAPDVDGFYRMIAAFHSGNHQDHARPPLNDNVKNVSRKTRRAK